MNYILGVNISKTYDDLPEHVFGQFLIQLDASPHVFEKVAALASLHENQVVRGGWKSLVKPDYVFVTHFLQDGDFVFDFLLLVDDHLFRLLEFLVDALHSHDLLRQLLDGDVDFAVSASSDDPADFVVAKFRRGRLFGLLEGHFDVPLDAPDFLLRLVLEVGLVFGELLQLILHVLDLVQSARLLGHVVVHVQSVPVILIFVDVVRPRAHVDPRIHDVVGPHAPIGHVPLTAFALFGWFFARLHALLVQLSARRRTRVPLLVTPSCVHVDALADVVLELGDSVLALLLDLDDVFERNPFAIAQPSSLFNLFADVVVFDACCHCFRSLSFVTFLEL